MSQCICICNWKFRCERRSKNRRWNVKCICRTYFRSYWRRKKVEDTEEQVVSIKGKNKPTTLDELKSQWELRTFSSDPTIILDKYIGTNTDIVIPGEVEGRPVKLKGKECFSTSDKKSIITSITFEPSDSGAKVLTNVSLSAMFENLPSLTSLDLRGLETSNVTNMSNMINGCKFK